MSTAAEQNAAGTPQLTLNGIEVPDVVPLETPSAPIPTLINTESGLRRAAEQLAAASGPVAVDTERARASATVRVLFWCSLSVKISCT